MSDATLIQRIEQAFADRKRPDNAIVGESAWRDPELVEVATAFGFTAREALSFEFLEEQAQSLFFLTPQAFAYYLPAYMIATLRAPDDTLNAADAVLFALAAARAEPPSERYRDALALLSPQELEAVQAYETALADEREAP